MECTTDRILDELFNATAAVSDAIDDPSSTVAPGFDVAQAITGRYGPGLVAGEVDPAEYRRLIEADQFR